MPYYRRPYKRARYGKKLKYSVQQKAVEFSTGSDDATAKIEVVPASEIEGDAQGQAPNCLMFG